MLYSVYVDVVYVGAHIEVGGESGHSRGRAAHTPAEEHGLAQPCVAQTAEPWMHIIW